MSRLHFTKLSPTLVFIGFLGNEDKIPKTDSEDNLSGFRLICAVGISEAISLISLTRIGLPCVQIESIVEAYNFGIQTFVIRGRLSLRIYTERSRYSGLQEYLLG
jgi:hypothetical protein